MGPPPGASPPMRMTASWSGSKRTCRIQVWRREAAPQMASSPRINTPGQALSDAAVQEARLRSSSLRVLRRRGAAKTQATLSGDFDPSGGGPIGCQGRPGSGILKGNPLEHSAWHPAVATGAFGTGAKQAWGVFDSTRAAYNVKEGGSICLTGLSFQ